MLTWRSFVLPLLIFAAWLLVVAVLWMSVRWL
jgi:hypothetical protein